MKMNQVDDHQTMLVIRVPVTKTKIPRSFTVVGDLYKICKQYLEIRKKMKKSDRLFLYMTDGKCENEPIGMNKIGAMPKKIATFLELPEPERYTGHCFRRTSATLFVDGGGEITNLKRHTGHKSNAVAEGYIENSIQNKKRIGEIITQSINVKSPFFTKKRREDTYSTNIDHDNPSTSTGIRPDQSSVNIPSTSTGIRHYKPYIIP